MAATTTTGWPSSDITTLSRTVTLDSDIASDSAVWSSAAGTSDNAIETTDTLSAVVRPAPVSPSIDTTLIGAIIGGVIGLLYVVGAVAFAIRRRARRRELHNPGPAVNDRKSASPTSRGIYNAVPQLPKLASHYSENVHADESGYSSLRLSQAPQTNYAMGEVDEWKA